MRDPVRIVGILNVTPDSFFDGGRFQEAGNAVRHGLEMAGEGAAMIDVGGQSTRPGHREVSAAEEIARVVPVIERLAAQAPIPLSIDTYKPEVARAALSAGARVLNDVRGFQGDPAMAAVAGEFACQAILMHWEAGFETSDGDETGRMARYFERSLAIASREGIPSERLALDPGIGFGKTQAQNLRILGRLSDLKAFGLPIFLGASRKSVIGHVLGGDTADRLEGTLAITVLAVVEGVHYVRVHDVRANVRAARMAEAILAR